MKNKPCPQCRGAIWRLCATCGGNGTVEKTPELLTEAEREQEIHEARVLMGLESASS